MYMFMYGIHAPCMSTCMPTCMSTGWSEGELADATQAAMHAGGAACLMKCMSYVVQVSSA